MSEVSATEASRNFADLLDAVEHGDETFTDYTNEIIDYF